MAVLTQSKLVHELLPPGFVDVDLPPRRKGKVKGKVRHSSPTSFNRHVKYRPLFALQVKDMRAAGQPASEIAKAFGVGLNTVYNWVARYPAFREAWQIGYAIANGRVEESLYKRALGYDATKEKVAFDKDGNTLRAKYQEHVPADVGAIKYWLGNRAPEQWRERQSVEHTGADGGPIEIQARQAAISDLLAGLRQAKRADPLALDAPAGSDLL